MQQSTRPDPAPQAPHWSDALPTCACHPARDWARTQPSYAVAWAACYRGTWMAWLLGYLIPEGVAKRRLALMLAEVARLACGSSDETRPRRTIEWAERYGRGEAVSFADLRAVSYVTDVANASLFAEVAANTAHALVTVGTDAAGAAHDVVIDASFVLGTRRCAEIVRRHYPEPPSLAGGAA